MAASRNDINVFERILVSPDRCDLKRDVILLPPRSLCELRIHCKEKRCEERVNVLLRTPQSRDGCFISETPLLDYFGRQTSCYRTKSYSIRDMRSGHSDAIQYCSRDGALWLSVEFIEMRFPPEVPVFRQIPCELRWGSESYSPMISFTRQELASDVFQYSCSIRGVPEQVVFTVEKKVLRENLLIRELKY